MTMTDFSSESAGETESGPTLAVYDDDGAVILYRWVETAMKIGDADSSLDDLTWIQVTHLDDGDEVIYDEINESVIGESHAPGVSSDEETTARFQPTQEGNTVTNTLIGETRLDIKKSWYVDGVDISGDESKLGDVKAVFTVTRNGRTYSFEDVPELSARYPDGQIVLSYADYSDTTGLWETVLQDLPRYDEYGREYQYQVEESSVTALDGKEWSVSSGIEQKVVEDELGNLITEKVYQYVNSIGPDGALIFDISKEWLDENDLLTRKPVTIGIFRISDNEQAAEVVLNVSNGWYKRVSVEKQNEEDTVEHYYVKEISVNGFDAEYGSMSAEDFAAAENSGSGEVLGQIDAQEDDGHLVAYTYEIMTVRNSHSDETAVYTVSNRRVGEMSIELTKTWYNGQMNPMEQHDLHAEFELYRSVDGGTEEFIESFILGEDEEELERDDEGNYRIIHRIENLPKYDEDGIQYDYLLKEVRMGDTPLSGDAGTRTAKVMGDAYVCRTWNSRSVIVGTAGHHTGDIYYWTSDNKRSDKYSLSVYKVWRDDGSSKSNRPDAYFELYRIAVTEDVFNENKDDLAAYCKANIGSAEQVGVDLLWNTKLNDWCWESSIGQVDRYDQNGNKYIYFLQEGYAGSSGFYQGYYCNTASPTGISDGKPNTSEAVSSTEEVLTVETSSMGTVTGGDVLILSDGTNEGADGCGDYYSRTTINGRTRPRTITGKKLWKFPSGWTIPKEQLPAVEIDIYSSTASDLTQEEVAAEVEKLERGESSALQYVNSVNLNEDGKGVYDFTVSEDIYGNELFYNRYGETVTYYLYEKTELENYSSGTAVVGTSNFTMTNSYSASDTPNTVEITVEKEWKSQSFDEINLSDLAPAMFRLYCVATDENGNDTGSSNLVSTAILKPVDDGTVSFTFCYQTGSSDANADDFDASSYDELPYISPTGYPFRYYVKETGLPTSCYQFDSSERTVSLAEAVGETGLYTGSVSYTGNDANSFNGGAVGFTASKLWLNEAGDELDHSYYRPESVTFAIWRRWDKKTVNGTTMPAGDELFTEVTVKAGYKAIGASDGTVVYEEDTDGWKAEWTDNLDQYTAYGAEITYYIKSERYSDDETEDALFKKLYSASAEGKYPSVYKNAFSTTSVSVKKSWVNDETDTIFSAEDLTRLSSIGYLPETIDFTLEYSTDGTEWSDQFSTLEDGTVAAKKLTKSFSVAETIDFEWDGLPKYNTEGEEYQYRVKEEIGDIVRFSTDDTFEKEVIGGSSFSGETASVRVDGNTVIFTDILDMTYFGLKKIWEDEDDKYGIRPDSVKITVAAGNGVLDYILTKPEKGNESDLSILLPALQNMESAEAVAEVYSVSEILEDKSYEISGISGPSLDDDGKYFWKVTNALARTTLTGTKVWEDGSNCDGIRPDSVILSLRRNGTEITDPEAEGISLEWQTEGDTWFYTYTGLVAYDQNNEAYTYTVTEKAVKYDDEPDEREAADGEIPVKKDKTYQISYSADSSGNQVITNTYEIERTEIRIDKEWVDASNADGSRPDSIKLVLFKNGVRVDDPTELGASVSWENKDTDRWTYICSNLPKYEDGKACEYTVEEEDVPTGYMMETKVEDETQLIVNTAVINIAVEKVWKDNHNLDDIRPESIEITLIGTGEDGSELVKVGPVTVSRTDENAVGTDGGFYYEFNNVPKYGRDGKVISYTVQEEEIPGYTASVTEDKNGGLKLINTHEAEEGPASIRIIKNLWDKTHNCDIAAKHAEFYVALFDSAELKVRASDIKTIVFDHEASSEIVFEGLRKDTTYYLAEMSDSSEDAVPINGSAVYFDDHIAAWTCVFDDGNAVTTSKDGKASELTFTNSITPGESELFEYYASFSLQKKVVDKLKAAKVTDETFYIGIYSDENCTHLYSGRLYAADGKEIANPVEFSMDGSSKEVYLQLLTDENLTVYFAETNKDGSRKAEDISDFEYTPEYSARRLDLNKYGKQPSIVITNREKDPSSKKDKANPKTGDTTPIALYAVLMMIAAAAIAAVLILSRRRKK